MLFLTGWTLKCFPSTNVSLWSWIGSFASAIMMMENKSCKMSSVKLGIICFVLVNDLRGSTGNPDARRLYDDLMSDYNRAVLPVTNNSDRVDLKLGIKLSQIIDLNLRSQILTTNVWVDQSWYDHKLKWDPEEYNGVEKLHIPSDQIWLPDVVVYNNADGNYEITMMTKATVHYTGLVVWKPPAIYKTACQIDVEYFPFDKQTCHMKFGTWSYDGNQVSLRHKYQPELLKDIPIGIDLSHFYLSVEWDVMGVPAIRNEKFYTCCPNPFLDITFYIAIRRKTLFYTVNLIIPCVTISAMSMVVFYLPSDSGEKVSLSISVLVSLGVFVLLLNEIIPPTSTAIPLLGRYLMFTMVLVTLSVCATILVLNVNFRSPCTHRMAPWVRKVFLQFLPKLLNIQRPAPESNQSSNQVSTINTRDSNIHKSLSPLMVDVGPIKPIQMPVSPRHHMHHLHPPQHHLSGNGGHLPPVESRHSSETEEFPPPPPPDKLEALSGPPINGVFLDTNEIPYPDVQDPSLFSGKVFMNGAMYEQHPSMLFDEPPLPEPTPLITNSRRWCSEFGRALLSIRFVAQHMENLDTYYEVEEDWKFVAMVLDRLFLWVFAVACVIGTVGIIFQAPSLYDDTQPIDIIYSKIVPRNRFVD